MEWSCDLSYVDAIAKDTMKYFLNNLKNYTSDLSEFSDSALDSIYDRSAFNACRHLALFYEVNFILWIRKIYLATK